MLLTSALAIFILLSIVVAVDDFTHLEIPMVEFIMHMVAMIGLVYLTESILLTPIIVSVSVFFLLYSVIHVNNMTPRLNIVDVYYFVLTILFIYPLKVKLSAWIILIPLIICFVILGLIYWKRPKDQIPYLTLVVPLNCVYLIMNIL